MRGEAKRRMEAYSGSRNGEKWRLGGITGGLGGVTGRLGGVTGRVERAPVANIFFVNRKTGRMMDARIVVTGQASSKVYVF